MTGLGLYGEHPGVQRLLPHPWPREHLGHFATAGDDLFLMRSTGRLSISVYKASIVSIQGEPQWSLTAIASFQTATRDIGLHASKKAGLVVAVTDAEM